MKLPKVQDTRKRPRVPFTCKCKNRKSYNWRQKVRQKCKCQTLDKYSQKLCVCLAPCTQTEAFLAQEIISPGETTWNCFNIRKKNAFCNTAVLSRKLLWYGRWIIWKMGKSPQTVYGLPRFYHNTLVFAKWRRKHASKNSSSSQDETNYTHFVPGQQLLVSPKFWLRVGGWLPLNNTFPDSLLMEVSGQKSSVAGNSRSDPQWVLAYNLSVNQSIQCDTFVLVSNPIKLWASLLAVCIFFLPQCHSQIQCHSLSLNTTCLYTSCGFSRQD